jgi:sulfhydrogenase subunit beta (sulfur reductase)
MKGKYEIAFISRAKIPDVFRKLIAKYTVLAPVKRGERPVLEVVNEDSLKKICLDEGRLISPKLPLLPPKEEMFQYSVGRKIDVKPSAQERPTIVFGLHSCDLRAIELLDKVLLEEPIDTYYQRRRKNTVLVSSDCIDVFDVCFCTRMGIKPHPERGFDLNLSSTKKGYIVEVGSEKGAKVFEEIKEFTTKVTSNQLKARRKRRLATARKVRGKKFAGVEKRIPSLKEKHWSEIARRCVECSGCIYICPTCYCFTVSDEEAGKGKFIRTRRWDPCTIESYQKVAAGVNPRPDLSSRLRHRIFHKFVYFMDQYGEHACCGCGRCVEVCLGDIDIRDTLEEANK